MGRWRLVTATLDWRSSAACNHHPDIDWLRASDDARAVCSTCPVSGSCLTDALQESRPFLGIRAGLTHAEHTAPSAPQKPQRRRWARPAACGTDGGYRRHLVNHEPTCDACKAAHALVVRKWAQAQARRRRARIALSTDAGTQSPSRADDGHHHNDRQEAAH